MFALRRSTPVPSRPRVTRPRRPTGLGFGRLHEPRSSKQLLSKAKGKEDEVFRQMREAPQGPVEAVGPTAGAKDDGPGGAARRPPHDSKPVDPGSTTKNLESERDQVLLAFLASTGYYLTGQAMFGHDKVGVVMDHEDLEELDPGLAFLYFQFVLILDRYKKSTFLLAQSDWSPFFSLLKRQRLIALGQAEGQLVLRQSGSSDNFSRAFFLAEKFLDRAVASRGNKWAAVGWVLCACGVLMAAAYLLGHVAWATGFLMRYLLQILVTGTA